MTHNSYFAIGQKKFLVVTDNGVLGEYSALDDAKEVLNGQSKKKGFNRFIAEVDETNTLVEDPHIVGWKQQTEENGFNRFWNDWRDIYRLIEKCQKYLDKTGILIELFHGHQYLSP